MIKTIIKTVLFTVTVLSIVFSIFLNNILMVFGLVSTSLDTFNELKQSQQIVETMKERNKSKKKKAPKRFAKKAGARVATSAVAAATIGTAAVTITVFGLEAHDYCEEKEQLMEEENLLFGSNQTFSYKKCLLEAKNDSKQIFTDAKDTVSEAVKTSWENTSDFTKDQWDEFVQDSGDIWKDLKNSTFQVFESWGSWTD